jgi:hypothetical protein
VVRYPDVAPFSVSHLGCCDLPKRGVIHYGKHEATHCRGVATGMVMFRVLSRTFRRRKPQPSPPYPSWGFFIGRPNWRNWRRRYETKHDPRM